MLNTVDEGAIEDLTRMSPEIHAGIVSQEEWIFLVFDCSLAFNGREGAEEIWHGILLFDDLRVVLVVAEIADEQVAHTFFG